MRPTPVILVFVTSPFHVIAATASATLPFGECRGFVETGENLEEAVHREVMEETGLTIKNLKYFGSQPWPYPSGLMIGFSAEYVDGEIHLQKEELSRGKWFTKENLPILPEKLSIARKLIDAWLADKL